MHRKLSIGKYTVVLDLSLIRFSFSRSNDHGQFETERSVNDYGITGFVQCTDSISHRPPSSYVSTPRTRPPTDPPVTTNQMVELYLLSYLSTKVISLRKRNVRDTVRTVV